MSEATLTFCIGATKAGTSWLYDYLAQHPQCHLRAIKELHFFDTQEQGSTDFYLKNLEKRAGLMLERAVGQEPEKTAHLHQKAAEIRSYLPILEAHDEQAYLQYLNAGRAPSQRLIADITPCYSLLSEECFRGMAAMTADVRFIFLMRDPVDRLWSHARMIASRRSKTGRDIERRAGRIFDRALSGGEPNMIARGDYKNTLDRAVRAIDPSRLFVATYEDMFAQDSVLERLCGFLDIDPIAGKTDRVRHKGVPVTLDSARRQRAAEILRPQYDFVAERISQLPSAWEKNMQRGTI